MVLHDNRLYMVDSNYNKLAADVYIGVYDIEDGSWSDFHIEAKTPFGIAVISGTIVGADWGGTGYQKGGVWMTSNDEHLGNQLDIVLPAWNWGRPTGLLSVKLNADGRQTPNVALHQLPYLLPSSRILNDRFAPIIA